MSRHDLINVPVEDPHEKHNVAAIRAEARVLSNILLPRGNGQDILGQMGEIELDGGALVVGPYMFAGYIDVSHKLIKSFSPGYSDHVAFFNNRYRPLTAQGYTLETTNDCHLLAGYPQEMYEFLQNHNVVAQLRNVFAGNSNPAAGRVRENLDGITEPFTTASRIVSPIDWAEALANYSEPEVKL